MIKSTNNQSGGGDLTPAQREILAHFNAMDSGSQCDLLCMAAAIAQHCPRQRPKLRVVGGRAA